MRSVVRQLNTSKQGKAQRPIKMHVLYKLISVCD